jgi:hypothetical protein
VPAPDVSESHRPIDIGRARGNTTRSPTSKLPSFVTSIDSAGDKARPKTANEAMDRRRELMALGSPISVTSGKETFNFPTPVRRPFTPNSDSRSVGMRSQDSDIGVALGSPSHAAHFQFNNSWALSPPQGRFLAPSREIITPVSTPGRSQASYSSQSTKPEGKEAEKPKLSRWKSLGGLFARRPSPRTNTEPQSQSPFQQRTSNPFDLSADGYSSHWQGEGPSTVIYTATPPSSSAAHFESPKKSSPRGRWGLGRSQTAPTNRRGGTSPQLPLKGPLLDVDIPTTQMERYSVMFNGVLPKQSSSSLLARRQANAEKTKPVPVTSLKVWITSRVEVSDQSTNMKQALDLPQPPKRRATTPEPSPSYRLLIFPPESSQQESKHITSTLHRPRPLRRSNTAPGALSPGLKNKSMEDTALSQLSPMSEREEFLEDSERQALTPTPSEPSTPNTPSDTTSEVQPFNPFPTDTSRNKTWSDSFAKEPAWEMITIGKVVEPGDRVSGQVRVEGGEEQEDWHHNSPVQVQVARSMSVTKARRLVGGPRVVGAKGGERLVDRKPLTPTLVQMVDVPGKHRKSIRATIEGFD